MSDDDHADYWRQESYRQIEIGYSSVAYNAGLLGLDDLRADAIAKRDAFIAAHAWAFRGYLKDSFVAKAIRAAQERAGEGARDGE